MARDLRHEVLDLSPAATMHVVADDGTQAPRDRAARAIVMAMGTA